MIQVNQDRRDELVRQLQGFFLTEFDEEMSAFRAEQILDHCLHLLGPAVYNQAVQDALKFIRDRLEDLDGEVRA